MQSDYWQKLISSRVSRRRAVMTTAGAGAGALFLAACGGGSDSAKGQAGTNKDASSLIVKAVDETKNAKKGGVYKNRGTFEPSTLDPHMFPNNFYVYQTYSNLWQVKDGVIDYANG